MFFGLANRNPTNHRLTCLGGGFEDFLFSPLLGELIQFDEYFSDGLKPPTRCVVLNPLYIQKD